MNEETFDKAHLEHALDFARGFIFNLHSHLTPNRQNRAWKEVKNVLEFCEQRKYTLKEIGWDEGMSDLSADFFRDYMATVLQYTSAGIGYLREGSFFDFLELTLRATSNAITGEVGVIGYTVGDVRRIFGGNVPDWYLKHKTEAFLTAPDDTDCWL